MVDNQNKYNNSRLRNILDGIPAVFCSLFLPKNKTRIILNSHFNERFDFNSKYLFLYLLENNYDCYFVINNDEFRNELINRYGNHFIETKSFAGKIFALRSKLWFVSAFEMPVGGIFLKLQRKVVHLTHGSLIKNVGTMEKNVSAIKRIYYALFIRTNLSYSIATSDFFVPSTACYTGLPESKILVTGFPRNDALFEVKMERPKKLENNSFKVLYAPTWRKDDDVHLFPFENFDFDTFNSFLVKNNITVYIRLHPYNEKTLDSSILKSNIVLFSTEDCQEVMDSLTYFDALITDYSSIAYDFQLLNRPMMFFPYDYEEYVEKVGFAVDYKKIAAGYWPKSVEELENQFVDMKTSDSMKKQREEICDLCNKYKSESCERLINTLKERKIKINKK